MSHTLDLDPQDQFVVLKLDGEINMLEVMHVSQQARKLCRERHIHRLLVDARQAQSHLSALDVYNLASDLAGKESLPGMHYAVVVGKDAPLIGLFGRMARLRGVRVEHYTGYADAKCDLLADHST